MATTVVEIAPSIPDVVPPEPAPPPSPAPAAPVPGAAPAAPPATPVPSEAEAAKLLSDAFKTAQATEPAPAGAAPAPGTISIDPATLTPELRAAWEQSGGDVAQFIAALAKGVSAPTPTTEPEPVVVEPDLVEPEPIVAPPPLTVKVLNDIVNGELMRDPTYAAIDRAYAEDRQNIANLNTEIQTHETEVSRIKAGLTFAAIKDDPVLKAENEAQLRDHRDEVSRLKADRRELLDKQQARKQFHAERDADVRSRVISDHQARTQEARDYDAFIAQRNGYANDFVKAWSPAVQAAAVALRIPPELVNERAQLEADARLVHGIPIEDIPAFIKQVAQKIHNETDVLGRVRSGQFATAAAARAAAVAGPTPAPPSFVPAPGSPTPSAPQRTMTPSEADKYTRELLRQNVAAAR